MQPGFDFAVFIGRFQPFHSGHLKVIQSGLQQADKLIVLIGSSWQARNPRNPWTHLEREQMIRGCLSEQENQRLICLPLMDVPYNDELWVRNVQTTVSGIVTAHHTTPHKAARIALIGHKKDQTGFYLNLFPHWKSIGVDNYREISATPLREQYFTEQRDAVLEAYCSGGKLPQSMFRWLTDFAREAPAYQQICEEIAFVNRYRKAWQAAPYAPTFVTVDAVLVQSGHILLVERKASPGKGLWALPGGFVDQQERLLDACLRELREETRLKVPAPVLKGSIRRQSVYDDPFRSSRGRTITHAFYIELEPSNSLPKVRGSDDAKQARWVPLGDIQPQDLFEDHYFIIQDMIGVI
ncbi:bifunctional nicotinamide-nucleotide adenylyltransferase/Nudix hydroxylase [Oceanobacter mangrovi]|uniref:bifunctional nicotinamide-nucleotide adenylyltransferase/Nudix hydroxylase n=1 Tax=Oceanobacter mangrovi TaxID=2862510 RepID=UPI001C8D47C8|nr:bifunctional nicotinamide-nucleotide adenylyltransferase/Nudix hydroxylase [Oceanobacter mangrovi]